MAVQEADPTLSFVAFFPLIQMLGLLVFWPAAAVGYVLGGLVAKKTPQGATATCTMLGTEGFAIYTRTPVADEVVLVRFDRSRLAHGDRTTRTIYRQAGDPGPGIEVTVRKASFVWTAPDGRELYRFAFDGDADRAPHAHLRFLGSAAFTHDRIVLGRELDGAGVRFAFTDSAEYIHVARQRIEFGFGAQPFSLAPPQISRAALQGDHIVFTLPTGPLGLPTARLADWPGLLSACEVVGITDR